MIGLKKNLPQISMETQVVTSKLKEFTARFSETKLALNTEMLTKSRSILNNYDFPTTRNEKWKYTRLSKLSKLSLVQIDEVGELSNIPLKNQPVISIINGNIDAIPEVKGLKISRFSENSEVVNQVGQFISMEDDVFHAMNTSFMKDGLLIEVSENQHISEITQIVFENQFQRVFAPTRIVIIAKKGSSAQFLFNFSSSCESFSLPIVECFVEENARLTIDKIQLEGVDSYSISTDQVYQKRDSYFKINTISLSGKFIRNNLNILVDGENCETHLNGAYLLEDDQLIDNHTIVDHLKPNCTSNELYKGVLNGKSTGVFNGKVFVRPDAQKINAFQSNANVLISDDASMNSKPELEINADDVKCSHGSTTGQMDEDAIFYLQARGISEKSAKALMTQAFIGDVLNKIDNEEVLGYVHSKLVELHDWVI
jgi:Fe-S cluster assembly protein SufD